MEVTPKIHVTIIDAVQSLTHKIKHPTQYGTNNGTNTIAAISTIF